MQETLADEPENFIKWNNGLTVVCEEVSFDESDSKVTIDFSEANEGICNGGHTYFSIVTAGGNLSDAGVHLEVIEVPEGLGEEERQDEIVEIAKKRNNINNLDNYTVADFLDCYQIFKDEMRDDRLVSWHENDSRAHSHAIDAPELIRILAALNADRYHHDILKPNSSYHKPASLSKSSIHTGWFNGALDARDKGEEPPLAHMSVLIDDILELRDMLAYTLKHGSLPKGFKNTNFYKEVIKGKKETTRDLYIGKYANEEGWKLRSTFEVMLLGMFRSNIYTKAGSDKDIRHIGWVLDPESIWDDRRENILEHLKRYYDDVGKSYRDFINSESPYELAVYKYSHDPRWPDPPAQILYDTETSERYNYVGNQSEATHWLENSSEGLIKISARKPSSGSPLYKIN